MYDTLFAHQALFFKALSHPRRLEIVTLLGHGPLSVTKIFSMLALPQANVSQHLLVLKQAGVVEVDKQGKENIYSLVDNAVSLVCQQVADMTNSQMSDTNEWRTHLPVMIDPVCGMRVSPRTAGATSFYQSTQYYFCASGCKQRFDNHPEEYLEHS